MDNSKLHSDSLAEDDDYHASIISDHDNYSAHPYDNDFEYENHMLEMHDDYQPQEFAMNSPPLTFSDNDNQETFSSGMDTLFTIIF